MFNTHLNALLDELAEVDFTVIDITQTPPRARMFISNNGPEFRSPLTGDRLTEADAFLFDHPGALSTPDRSIYRDSCYICRDPDFAMMGMPLCKACRFCGGHVAADDSNCDDCGKDQLPDCMVCGKDDPECQCPKNSTDEVAS